MQKSNFLENKKVSSKSAKAEAFVHETQVLVSKEIANKKGGLMIHSPLC